MRWIDWLRLSMTCLQSFAFGSTLVLLWRVREQHNDAEKLLDEVNRDNAEAKVLLYGSDELVVVPRQPTQEMLRAAGWYGTTPEDALALWESMLQAYQASLPRRAQKVS